MYAQMQSIALHNVDKAGKQYWDQTERNQHIEMVAFTGRERGARDLVARQSHSSFESAFSNIASNGKKLLELGCGGSRLLPYFEKQFGFEAYGIDYSEHGCELAREMCRANGVPPRVICTDLFDSRADLRGAFDVVFSGGVLEHFTNTEYCLTIFASFLKPGGVLITTIPNMGGLTGFMQRMLSREIFEKHKVLTPDILQRAHESVGLEILRCEYIHFIDFGVVNAGYRPPLYKKLFLGALTNLTSLTWKLESLTGSWMPNRISSPHVWCTARKTARPS